jgi:hypothetical protein
LTVPHHSLGLRRTVALHTSALNHADAESQPVASGCALDKRTIVQRAGARCIRGPYAGCVITNKLVKLKSASAQIKTTQRRMPRAPRSRLTGYVLFRTEFTNREWPLHGNQQRFPVPHCNRHWLAIVVAAWRSLSAEERCKFSLSARHTNEDNNDEDVALPDTFSGVAMANAPHAAKLPWQIGSQKFPLRAQDVLAKSHVDYIGDCDMVMDDPELRASVERELQQCFRHIPCWRKGFCLERISHSLMQILGLHKTLQQQFVHSFGKEVCRSGDACVYFRGRPRSGVGEVFEIFAIIACQCLKPYRSILHVLHVPGNGRTPSHHPLVYTTNAPALPKELHLFESGSSEWSFKLSTSICVAMLDSPTTLSWDVSLLNYSHKSSCELIVRDSRKTVDLHSEAIDSVCPLSVVDVSDLVGLFDDEELHALDGELAALFRADAANDVANADPVAEPPMPPAPVLAPPIEPPPLGTIEVRILFDKRFRLQQVGREISFRSKAPGVHIRSGGHNYIIVYNPRSCGCLCILALFFYIRVCYTMIMNNIIYMYIYICVYLIRFSFYPFVVIQVEVRGYSVYRVGNDNPIGKYSVMLQWAPVSFSMKCRHKDHVNCTKTSDCTEQALQSLVHWVASADRFDDTASHKACEPCGLRG